MNDTYQINIVAQLEDKPNTARILKTVFTTTPSKTGTDIVVSYRQQYGAAYEVYWEYAEHYPVSSMDIERHLARQR